MTERKKPVITAKLAKGKKNTRNCKNAWQVQLNWTSLLKILDDPNADLVRTSWGVSHWSVSLEVETLIRLKLMWYFWLGLQVVKWEVHHAFYGIKMTAQPYIDFVLKLNADMVQEVNFSYFLFCNVWQCIISFSKINK